VAELEGELSFLRKVCPCAPSTLVQPSSTQDFARPRVVWAPSLHVQAPCWLNHSGPNGRTGRPDYGMKRITIDVRQEHQIEMEEAATRALALEAHMEAAQVRHARVAVETMRFSCCNRPMVHANWSSACDDPLTQVCFKRMVHRDMCPHGLGQVDSETSAILTDRCRRSALVHKPISPVVRQQASSVQRRPTVALPCWQARVAELQQGRELADADEAANDAAGVASAATDDSDRLVAELRERLADAERRQHQAAAQASVAVSAISCSVAEQRNGF